MERKHAHDMVLSEYGGKTSPEVNTTVMTSALYLSDFKKVSIQNECDLAPWKVFSLPFVILALTADWLV